MMETYIIYTTKTASYIVPKEKAKLPKEFSASFEIDSPVKICNRRCRLPAKVNKAEDVNGVLVRLFEVKKNAEEAKAEGKEG